MRFERRSNTASINKNGIVVTINEDKFYPVTSRKGKNIYFVTVSKEQFSMGVLHEGRLYFLYLGSKIASEADPTAINYSEEDKIEIRYEPEITLEKYFYALDVAKQTLLIESLNFSRYRLEHDPLSKTYIKGGFEE
jgi:hypothetical protein